MKYYTAILMVPRCYQFAAAGSEEAEAMMRNEAKLHSLEHVKAFLHSIELHEPNKPKEESVRDPDNVPPAA